MQKKLKNKVECIIFGLMLLFHAVYFLMPVHIRMAEKSCHGLFGLFLSRPILFEVSLLDRDYLLKSDQIVTRNFRAAGLSQRELLSEISSKRPIILVVKDDDLSTFTDKMLVVVEDVHEGCGNFQAQYLYPLSYKEKRTGIVLHKIRKPEQTTIYAFLRNSYFLRMVKEGNVAALYDRCQSEVRNILLSQRSFGAHFPERE